MDFNELLLRRRNLNAPTPKRMLVIDPGHTIGWALFKYVAQPEPLVMLNSWGQIKFKDPEDPHERVIHFKNELIDRFEPKLVVCEEYLVYGHKTDQHSWSRVPTLRMVATVQTLCVLEGIPCVTPTASIGKSFCTNDKLKEWGLYKRGGPHQNDAIRHGCHYLLFGKSPKRTS